ncbi:MAG: restriction endonuclease [Methylovulum sp.]|nr:restriction endonuclease [Methylovulum sp.]
MINLMFQTLSERADGGLGPFRAMLHSLLKWDHFDPYYFEKLKKLDRNEAERHLNHLRQLQEIRDTKSKAERQARESAEVQAQKNRNSLSELRNEFLELHAGKFKPQQRGYALEKILAGLARLDALEVTEPFRVIGEQIDGALKFDGEHYVIEAKWHDKLANNESVYQFATKVEGKMYGRGLFVSIQGFSENVIQSMVQGKALRTIFIDGQDVVLVLEEQISFTQMIDKKVKAAQTKGLIYVNPISGLSKIRDL